MDQQTIELLIQIARNTRIGSTIVVPIITALATLSAAVIGSYFVYRQSNKRLDHEHRIKITEIRADVISKEKLLWLRELKDLAGKFYTSLDLQFNLLRMPINPQQNPTYNQQVQNYFSETTLLGNQLILSVNAEKPNEARLKQSVDGALALMLTVVNLRNSGNFNFPQTDYTNNKRDFFKAMQDIHKQVWGDVEKIS